MDRTASIRRRYQAGEAVKAIAFDLGISASTVYAALREDSPRKGSRSAYQMLHVRVTGTEIDALDRAASQYGEASRSGFVRRLIRLGSNMPSATPDDEVYLAGLERHLRALSGNFNQIARDLSASRRKIGEANPHQSQIDAMNEARAEVRKLRSAIRHVLQNSQMRNAEHIAQLGPDEDSAPDEL